MASYFLHLHFLFLIFFLVPCIEPSVITCPASSCSPDSPLVQFPFRLTNRPGLGPRCGYPGFDISCNNRNRTILTLPGSGDFSVVFIDYQAQTLWLHDHCFARRLLNFSLSGSPFRVANNPQSLTFLNCSSSFSGAITASMIPVRCLGGQNYSVMYAPTSQINNGTYGGCDKLATVSVSFAPEFEDDIGGGIILTWDTPDCKSCLARGGVCGLKSGSDSNIGCTNVNQSRGLPRGVKYGIIIGVGIPVLMCLIGFACYIGGRLTACGSQNQTANFQDSTIVGRPLELYISRGLDGPTIESYPKTLLGESRRLPKPGDNICPICLSEYQSKEALRTIPECCHYFHADCIDEWLKMNSTCPLCRNSPGGSATVTPREFVSA